MKYTNSPYTLKQKEIIIYLYRFRFLTTLQFQKLFNHKDPHRIKEWLKDLKDKKYIGTNYSRKSFEEGNKPAIYFLKPLARNILKNEKNFDTDAFNSRIYKEHKRGNKFINHKLFVVDMYLFFLSKKDKEETLQFFTETDLIGYEYFPDTELCAYIAFKTGNKTRRYLLNIFDPYTPAFILRKRVKQYIVYSQDTKWKENTNNAPFPQILFVLPSQNMQTHIFEYAKAKLEKENSDLSLFLTTKEIIRNDSSDIWKRVK